MALRVIGRRRHAAVVALAVVAMLCGCGSAAQPHGCRVAACSPTTHVASPVNPSFGVSGANAASANNAPVAIPTSSSGDPRAQVTSSSPSRTMSVGSPPTESARAGSSTANAPAGISTSASASRLPSTTASASLGPLLDLGVDYSSGSASVIHTQLDRARAAGATIISVAADWAGLKPTQTGPYVWNLIDETVNGARARGMQVRLRAYGLPSWARDSGDPSGAWVPPRSAAELSRWATFVGTLAAHFAGRANYIEVWNEPNLDQFWSTGANPSQFAALLHASYPAIKAAAPSIKVISGGLSENDVGYLDAVYTAEQNLYGSAAATHDHYFDLLGVHPYSGNRSPTVVLAHWHYESTWGARDENFTGFTYLHTAMAQHGEAAKQIYIGEYSFSTVTWNGNPPVPDATRATYVRQAFTVAGRYSYVLALSWFYLTTNQWDGTGWGLLTGSAMTPTATYNALAAFERS